MDSMHIPVYIILLDVIKSLIDDAFLNVADVRNLARRVGYYSIEVYFNVSENTPIFEWGALGPILSFI